MGKQTTARLRHGLAGRRKGGGGGGTLGTIFFFREGSGGGYEACRYDRPRLVYINALEERINYLWLESLCVKSGERKTNTERRQENRLLVSIQVIFFHHTSPM